MPEAGVPEPIKQLLHVHVDSDSMFNGGAGLAAEPATWQQPSRVLHARSSNSLFNRSAITFELTETEATRNRAAKHTADG